MTAGGAARFDPRAAPPRFAPGPAVLRWLIGIRLVAVTAVLVGALLVQTTTDELLPITPLAHVAAVTYALSLIWLGLLLARLAPGLQTTLQVSGDLLIIATLIYVTGGPWSPFPFLFLLPVGLSALLLGLRGALTVAGGAFVIYGGMALAMVYGLLPAPAFLLAPIPPDASTLSLQLFINGLGFGLVALLTSYLAHSWQQAEIRLRGEREAGARLLALSADVVRSVDSGVIAADTRGTVVLANPAARRILQLQGEIEGRPIAALVPIEGVDWAAVLAALATPPFASQRVEGRLEGKELLLGFTVTPLAPTTGDLLGVVLNFRDLTQAREQERRERLRQRLAAVGEMAAGMAHEVRNPLASISGSAQVLARVPTLRDKDRTLMRIIVEESQRLSRIIETFLLYARPPRPERGQCDIARNLQETLDLFVNSPEVTARHRVERTVRPHPGLVVADEGQLRQAFFNLARNAIQAMPDGGTLWVDAGPEGGDYVIRWRDEGVGMEPRQVEEVFQPFTAFRTGGTGLGLAVVYSIFTDHGGEVVVDSAPGRGTTFTLRLPLEQA